MSGVNFPRQTQQRGNTLNRSTSSLVIQQWEALCTCAFKWALQKTGGDRWRAFPAGPATFTQFAWTDFCLVDRTLWRSRRKQHARVKREGCTWHPANLCSLYFVFFSQWSFDVISAPVLILLIAHTCVSLLTCPWISPVTSPYIMYILLLCQIAPFHHHV